MTNIINQFEQQKLCWHHSAKLFLHHQWFKLRIFLQIHFVILKYLNFDNERRFIFPAPVGLKAFHSSTMDSYGCTDFCGTPKKTFSTKKREHNRWMLKKPYDRFDYRSWLDIFTTRYCSFFIRFSPFKCSAPISFKQLWFRHWGSKLPRFARCHH